MVKIICTVSELRKIFRGCEQSSCCDNCALHLICGGKEGDVEGFFRADLIRDDVKEENE